MSRYHYTAVSSEGKKLRGIITAENPYGARKQLRVRGMHPTSVNMVDSVSGAKLFSLFSGKTVRSQVIEFTKQMATLLNAGIKLTEALSVFSLQVSDVRFKSTISDIRDRVVTGESFTDALKDYSDYFDIIYISMVRVGEVTGSIGQSLSTISDFMEKRRRVESRVTTAMIYPMVLVFFCLMAIIILTTKVIPKIAEQVTRTGQELPWLTRQMMNFGHILTSWWLFVVIAVIVLVVWFVRRFLKTQRGAYLSDSFILSLPLFGPLIKHRVIARFASTLSTLLGSGLPMAESLSVVSEVTGNSLMKKAVIQARERILAGADIATPLRDSGVIGPAIAHMVAVGEKSGELEKMLKTISDDLESETDVVIERLGTAIEPVIIVIMAIVIGLIAYATIVPILEVSSGNF